MNSETMCDNDSSQLKGSDESKESFEVFGGDEVNYNRLFETELRFATHLDALDWAQKIAFASGFALVIASKGDKNRTQPGLQGAYFRCSRYGRTRKKKIDPNQPETPDKPKKKGTTKCQCQFLIRAVENIHVDKDDKEIILWNILTSEKRGFHNHKMTKYKDGDRHFAGLDASEKEFVRQQVRASIPPRDIKNGLHQRTPDKPQPSSTQIYSEANKVRQEIRGMRNPAQQVLALAVAAEYVEWHKSNPETNEITHAYMAHPESVKLFRAYPHVAIIDSTYKTNVYNCALVEIVGVTPCGNSFLIAFVLLPTESAPDYVWMLRKLGELLECTGGSVSCFVTDRELGLIAALEDVYPHTPHILCRWHINRAIEAKVIKNKQMNFKRNYILTNKDGSWTRVIDSATEEDFRSNWEDFSIKWSVLSSYVRRTWGKYTTKFVLCYTNRYFHLGNTATSRVESAHSLLKAWVKSANCNLDTMWIRIDAMLQAQHSKIRQELEQSRSRPRNGERVFSLLQGNVSIKAIGIMETEMDRGFQLGIGLADRCGCALRVTHGLPCACILVPLQEAKRRVHLEDIHPFWRTLEYDNEEARPKTDNDELENLIAQARRIDPAKKRLIIEKMREGLHPEDEDILPPPVRENPKGRPRGSTTRNLSGFEHAKRKHGTPTANTTTNPPPTVGDFAPGPIGAPLEIGYTKGPLSSWNKKWGVPEEIRCFFDGWVDVGADGHCGFRVISHAARGREDDYLVMREWCGNEIRAHDRYKGFFGNSMVTLNGFTQYQNMLRRIEFTGRSGCGEDHWLAGDLFFVFATIFNWTICVIGQFTTPERSTWQCQTYLPFRSSGHATLPYGVLWVVNYHSHWMRLHSTGPPGEVPMPPIDFGWEGERDPSVAHYADFYKTNIESWHTCMGTSPFVSRRQGIPKSKDADAARKLNFENVIIL